VSKAIIIPLLIVAGIAVPTMFGLIPPVLGVAAMLMVVALKDIIMMIFLRGLPMAIASCRMRGGMLWAVIKRGGRIRAGRVEPKAGMVPTKEHGRFTLMGRRVYNLDGVPIAFAPEDIGYNIGFDHAALVNILRARGINDITEVCDVDKYGFVVGFKDDPRIRDLKEDDETIRKLREKYGMIPGVEIDLTGFDDFVKYTMAAASPFHQDVNIKEGISQGLMKRDKGGNVGLWVIIGVIVGAVIAFVAAWLLGGHGGETVVKIVENAATGTIIPT